MASIKKYSTAKGDRWRVQFRTPDQRVTQRRGFKTKREAEDFAATTHVSKLRGEYIDPADAQVTIGELGPEWLARRTHLKPSSRRVEEIAWRVHVAPRWSKVKLVDLRHTAVQTWVSEMGRKITDSDGQVTKPASGPVTVIRAYNLLAGIVDDAVRDRRLTTNPARGVKLPRKVKPDRAYLTDEQVWALAGEAGPDKAPIVLVLAYCGLRWGELAGLHVADIDTLRRRIHIRRNAVNVGGTVEVGSPKTHELRVVPFPAFLVDPLARACQGKGRDGIVFPTPKTGEYAKPPGVRSWFEGAVTRCAEDSDGFPRVTPHDLRHTAASLAISSGANVKAVQRMLGHASAAMTLDVYADLFDTDADAVADAHDLRLQAAGFVAKTQPKEGVNAAG